MSIKVITQFFLLTIIATYFAFLNPNEVNVHLTQTFSIHIPLVVFLLGSSLLGALAATLVYWSHGIKKTVETFRLKYFHRRQLQEQESLDEIEENFGKRYLDEELNDKENPYGLTEFDIEEIDELLNVESELQ